MNLVHFLVLLGTILILPVEMKSMERMTVARGDSFTFDCQIDQSLYFAERLGDWSEILEHDENFLFFNMKFDYLDKEKLLRVKIDSAQNQHQLYFGCRKANWASTSMSQIYQIIVAGKFCCSMTRSLTIRTKFCLTVRSIDLFLFSFISLSQQFR